MVWTVTAAGTPRAGSCSCTSTRPQGDTLPGHPVEAASLHQGVRPPKGAGEAPVTELQAPGFKLHRRAARTVPPGTAGSAVWKVPEADASGWCEARPLGLHTLPVHDNEGPPGQVCVSRKGASGDTPCLGGRHPLPRALSAPGFEHCLLGAHSLPLLGSPEWLGQDMGVGLGIWWSR